jgi:hypothetical protein
MVNKFFEDARNVAKAIDEGTYIYTPSSTDITIRWRKVYGYVPASEQAKYQKKWSEFRALSARTLENVEIPEIPGVVQWKKWQKS